MERKKEGWGGENVGVILSGLGDGLRIGGERQSFDQAPRRRGKTRGTGNQARGRPEIRILVDRGKTKEPFRSGELVKLRRRKSFKRATRGQG